MISEQAIQSATRHQVLLEGFKAEELKQMSKFLKKLDKSLRERITRADVNDLSKDRLQALLADVKGITSTITGDFRSSLVDDLGELALSEASFEVKLLEDIVQADYTLPVQLKAAVFAHPLSVRGAGGGELLKDVLKRFETKSIQRINGIINQGYFEGQTNQQILDAIRGTKAAKYKNGHMALMSRGMEALVRTGVQHVSSVARQEVWSANDDIVEGYRWVSTLDSRTTDTCQALDGREFKLGKGPTPPIHIGCRSTTAPTFYGDVDFKDKGATRSSVSGQVSADLSYYDWLKIQDIEFQDEVLGKTLGKVFRDGGLSSTRFSAMRLDKNFKPLTLERMREIEPLAFKRAA